MPGTAISLVDFGMGNLRSVRNALDRIGAAHEVVTEPGQVARASRLLLPGVGSFAAGMEALQTRGLAEPIAAAGREGRPLLGICLGMQLLVEHGEEGGSVPGLGLIPGRVVRLEPRPGFKVPHMGWCGLQRRVASPLLAHLTDDMDFYFVHSYHVVCDEGLITSTFEHGGRYVASLERGKIFGVQFHPEKSQRQGLRILQNFAEL